MKPTRAGIDRAIYAVGHEMMHSNINWQVLPTVAAVLTLALAVQACCGQSPDGETAVQAGQDALNEGADFPWYDADSDSIRRIEVQTAEEPAAHRNSTWQAGPQQASTASSRAMGASSLLAGLLQTIIWGGLLLLLALVIAFLVRAFINAEPIQDDGLQRVVDDTRSEEDLIESLPFDLGRPQTNLLGEARRHYEQGAYREAIIYLFSYQLVRLDQHHLIRLTRGKTNRQYLGEVASQPRLQKMLGRTMVAFEDVFFGEHNLDRERFEDCWFRLDDFHRRLDEVAV
jgi:hypothetical protein